MDDRGMSMKGVFILLMLYVGCMLYAICLLGFGAKDLGLCGLLVEREVEGYVFDMMFMRPSRYAYGRHDLMKGFGYSLGFHCIDIYMLVCLVCWVGLC